MHPHSSSRQGKPVLHHFLEQSERRQRELEPRQPRPSRRGSKREKRTGAVITRRAAYRSCPRPAPRQSEGTCRQIRGLGLQVHLESACHETGRNSGKSSWIGTLSHAPMGGVPELPGRIGHHAPGTEPAGPQNTGDRAGAGRPLTPGCASRGLTLRPVARPVLVGHAQGTGLVASVDRAGGRARERGTLRSRASARGGRRWRSSTRGRRARTSGSPRPPSRAGRSRRPR